LTWGRVFDKVKNTEQSSGYGTFTFEMTVEKRGIPRGASAGSPAPDERQGDQAACRAAGKEKENIALE
jgi:hypothetical protein